jgi:hypothetical protein
LASIASFFITCSFKVPAIGWISALVFYNKWRTKYFEIPIIKKNK